MNVTQYDFLKAICNDSGLSMYKEYVLNMPTDKKTLKGWVRGRAHQARIFDGEKEYPYMIDKHTINDKKLLDAKEIRVKGLKGFNSIIKESGLKLKSEKCRICEGGGWYSQGYRYYYKNLTCEL